jgi:pyruvate/2-oxoglutarate dehydrogenase complex dihydrolipoamide dehydrogenase (E3) component
VGGECTYWACIPSKTLPRPGEAVHGARAAAPSAEVDVKAALGWVDVMVSDYSDVGQEHWLAKRGIDLLRGGGRLVEHGVVDVDGVRHTADHAPLGEALRRHGTELLLGLRVTAARRDGEEFVLKLEDGRELRGDWLPVATGRRPGVAGLGLETVGVSADAHGTRVDSRARAGERLWAIGDVVGIWPLTHVGECHGEIVASNTLGERRGPSRGCPPRHLHRPPGRPRRRGPGAVHRNRPAIGGVQDRHLHALLRRVERLSHAAQRRRADDGAYALGPEAGEWAQQATLAIRASVRLEVVRDTIQPFPSSPDIYADAVKALRLEVEGVREPVEAGLR